VKRVLCILIAAGAWAADPAPDPRLPISAVAFSPDSKMLAVGAYQEVLLWDLQNAKLAMRAGAGQLSEQVRAVAYNKNGKVLAAAAGLVRLIDPATGAINATLGESKDEIFALAFNPEGTLLATGGADAIVRIWTLSHPGKAVELKAHAAWITGLAFSPNGKLLASGSTDRTVQIWDTGDWKPIVSLPQTVTEPVGGVAFSTDGTSLNFITAGPEERAIRVWRPDVLEQKEVNGRKPNTKFTRPFDTGSCLAQGIAWAGGARPRLLLACTDKTVRAVNANGGWLATMSGHQDWVYTVVSNADGTRLASGSADGTVRLWNGADHTLLAVLMQLKPRTDECLFVASKPAAKKK
jgi:WD40 repeat protein